MTESRTIGAWTVRRKVTKANVVVDAMIATSGWEVVPIYAVDGTVFLEHGEVPLDVLRAVVEMATRELCVLLAVEPAPVRA